MPTNMHAAEFYRREADRLYTMSEAEMFADIRAGLLDMAQRYQRLAAQRERLADPKRGPSGRVAQKASQDSGDAQTRLPP